MKFKKKNEREKRKEREREIASETETELETETEREERGENNGKDSRIIFVSGEIVKNCLFAFREKERVK